ncbi:MAG: portal protein [Candidatus Gastranaerophilales bacterium]|nr:portal protein [Candidatus Gastranaerophilales bacterium]
MEENKKTLQSEYENLKTDREPWLSAAKEAAKYTIPSIMPSDTDITKNRKSKTTIVTPHQSVGADGVNNLASKVTTTLLPPNQTFFKFKMDKAAIMQTANEAGQDQATIETEINKGLANLETMILDYMESSSDRVCLGEAMKHLYIAGNVLLVYDSEKGLKYYPLSRYVIKRDYYGNPQKVITEEKIAFLELPEKLREEVLKKYLECAKEKSPDEQCEKLEDKELTLYTGFKRCKNVWKVYQEVEGIELTENAGQYPIDICPFIPLRYVRVDGEDYGRGLIEDYFGDISYLDTLCLAIKESSLAASKLIMLVNPASNTKIRRLAQAKNGDFVEGRAEDIAPLQVNKYYDLQTAQAEADKIERRLNRIFVMKAAVQRQAERVDTIALLKLS